MRLSFGSSRGFDPGDRRGDISQGRLFEAEIFETEPGSKPADGDGQEDPAGPYRQVGKNEGNADPIHKQ